jgi:MoaA/NifB/PqqE/SkfB family radical SAM enzyme
VPTVRHLALAAEDFKVTASKPHLDWMGLAAGGFVNTLLQPVSHRSGIALCRPSMVYLIPTARCRLGCRHCDVGRERDYRRDELSTSQWRALLAAFGRWARGSVATFTGGEPFLRPDLPEILRAADEHRVIHGVVTSGVLPDPAVLDDLAGLGTSFFAVSLDAADAATVDSLRGRSGTFEESTSTIVRLSKLRRSGRLRAKIVVKMTLMEPNADQIGAVVDLARRLGADGVQLQPLEQNYSVRLLQSPDESWHERSPLWPRDLGSVRRGIEDAKRRKRTTDRWFLLNSERELESYIAYFDDLRAVRAAAPICSIGWRTLFVAPWGEAGMCPRYGAVGDLDRDSFGEIWSGPRAAAQRRRIEVCRAGCVSSCFVERTFTEKVGLFWGMFGAG